MTAATARHHFWRAAFAANGGLHVRGTLPEGGCVIVAAHRTHADAPALLAAIDSAHAPVVAAAADYWFRSRPRALVCRRVVAGFPVRRTGGGYADLAARRPALAAGQAVVVFPAGSRHGTAFHEGAFRLAHQAGVPVVVAELLGTARVLSDGRLRRSRVSVRFHAAMDVTDVREAARRAQVLLGAAEALPQTSSVSR